MKNIKKRLSLIILLVMLMLSFGQSFIFAETSRDSAPTQGNAVSREQIIEFTENDFRHDIAWDDELNKEVCKITGLNASGAEKLKNNKNLNIPNQMAGKKVEAIGKYAFRSKELISVSLPSTLIKVEDGAFAGNSIKTINFPDTLEIIEQNAFCYNEIENILIPNRVKKIGLKAFGGNSIKRVEIDNFEGSVVIGAEAFDYFKIKYLKTKDEPAPGTYLPEDFTYNGNLVDGFSSKGLAKYKKQGADEPISLPVSDTKGKQITGIDEYAFSDVSPTIRGIKIPEGYKTIGSMAFQNSEIKSVTLPDSIEEVDGLAFFNNKGIEVKLHVSSKKIADRLDDSGNCWIVVVDNNPAAAGIWKPEDFTFEDRNFKITDSDEALTLKAVTGFSEKGKKKLAKNKDLVLPTVDADGKKVEAVEKGAFQGTPSVKRLNSLVIPEGYRIIGSMAFAFNSCGGELILPDSMEFVDSAAFFRNEFTVLTVPAKITDISLSMMRGNKLNKVIFKGNIETIGRLAFAENSLEEIKVSDSLKNIGVQAFTTNTGSDKYDGKVVIRTASGNNPNKLPDKENYLIDPKNPGSTPSINYKEWTVEDFDYDGSKVVGFSEQGRKKIRKNKNLVIPDRTSDGLPVETIGIDAFRNLNQGYDIESVKLPDTVKEIEDYAFQFNSITNFKMPRDLKKLGMGVFMMAGVDKIEWNDKIEYIDQACFYMCELGKLEIPASVEVVMNAAFRKCSLTELKFAKESKLKNIESLAFADNKLSKMDLPKGIEVIGSQAFGNNKFKELNAPDSLKEIGFQAFLGNPDEKNPVPVEIHTVDAKNPNGLTDDIGKSFVIDPKVKADAADLDALKKAVDEADKIDQDKLTVDFGGFFKNVLKDAKACLKDKNASKGKVRGLTKETTWAIGRAELNTLMHEKETLEPNKDKYDAEKWKAVEAAYKAAKQKLMTINISDDQLSHLINTLSVALKSLNESTNPLAGAAAYEGEFDIKRTHYIEPYTVKVKVWVKDGKILHVIDNGTVCDDPNDDEEHNGGYYKRALEILSKYKGKSVKDVKANNLGKELGIDVVSGATVSCNALHGAVKNALKKADEPEQPEELHITASDSKINKNNGVITGDAELTYFKGKSTGAEFRITGISFNEGKKNLQVKVDGKIVKNGKDYILREGSIIVGFKKGYLDNLDNGLHEVCINTSKGEVKAAILIKGSQDSTEAKTDDPFARISKEVQTGDESKISIFGLVLVAAFAGLHIIKKRLQNRK